MATWIKPSGQEIDIRDDKEHEAKAESLGWKKKAKRGRPKKSEQESEQEAED